MINNIMVIGGYGQVGAYVCRALKGYGEHVLAAGRNVNKCMEFAKKCGIAYREVDVNCWKDNFLDDIECVIMCLENSNELVLDACIRRQVNYVDISPSYSIIEQIRNRKSQITQAGICVCAGVGIAPGISNVLCEKMTGGFDEIDEINSYLMLGVGESHGKNAVQWLVNNLNVEYYENDEKGHVVRSFSNGRNITFPGEKRRHRFVRIDLADWHIMKEKHPEAKVNAWYAYDMNSVTYLFELLQKMRLFRLLKYAWFKRFFTKIMNFNLMLAQKVHLGTNAYASFVEISGKRDGKLCEKQDIIQGNENSKITAKVSALTAIKLRQQQPGFYYMCELMKKEEFCEK